MIRFECQCGKTLQADEQLASKRARRPSCGTVIVLPNSVPEAVSPSAVQPTLPANLPVKNPRSATGPPVAGVPGEMQCRPIVSPIADEAGGRDRIRVPGRLVTGPISIRRKLEKALGVSDNATIERYISGHERQRLLDRDQGISRPFLD